MTIAFNASDRASASQDLLSGTARAHAIDRWIFVFTAASLIAFVFVGFIPDSFMKVAAVDAGQRPPFPPILHVHAVLMGSFLLLLLAQAVLVATGRRRGHMQLGIAGTILAPAIVISGFLLIPAMYAGVPVQENILLLQLKAGLLFAICMAIALQLRMSDSGVHKRLVFLALAAALPAAFDRIQWLPSTMPNHPLSADIYSVLAFSPMFVWDLVRNRSVHRAYLIFAALFIPATAVVYALWDKPWWHAMAHHMLSA